MISLAFSLSIIVEQNYVMAYILDLNFAENVYV